MSTPRDHQDPDRPYPSGQQPGRDPQAQGTYAPEDDIPRQQAGGRPAYAPYPQSGGYEDPCGPAGAGPLGYLDGGRVGFGAAVRLAFSHMFTYRGRASRSAFWWFALVEVIAYVIVSFLSDESRVIGVILDVLVGIPFILAGISLAVRRLHDSGKSGWWWWLGFIPVIGGIVLLVCYALPGTPGPNRYSRRSR